MNTRLRFLTGLLVLVTVTAYFADGVAAVVFCPPAESLPPTAVQEQGRDGHGAEHEPGADTQQRSHCPPGMASGVSCAAALVPVVPAAAMASNEKQEVTFLAPNPGYDLTAGHPLFHPPRA